MANPVWAFPHTVSRQSRLWFRVGLSNLLLYLWGLSHRSRHWVSRDIVDGCWWKKSCTRIWRIYHYVQGFVHLRWLFGIWTISRRNRISTLYRLAFVWEVKWNPFETMSGSHPKNAPVDFTSNVDSKHHHLILTKFCTKQFTVWKELVTWTGAGCFSGDRYEGEYHYILCLFHMPFVHCAFTTSIDFSHPRRFLGGMNVLQENVCQMPGASEKWYRYQCSHIIGVSKNRGIYPKIWWFMLEKPTLKMDDLGVPLFLETPNTYISSGMGWIDEKPSTKMDESSSRRSIPGAWPSKFSGRFFFTYSLC